MEAQVFNFNYGWKFRLADAFPLKHALEATKDASGHFFYERAYQEEGWKEVSVPHTYNDEDLFVNRIEDAGSNQKRTFSCYRKWFTVPKENKGKKVFIEFEGIRQTCYLYMNGKMAGYYEAGVAPFGFDLTPYLDESGENLVAVATDSTSSRNMDYFGAETPNLPEAEPGSFMTSLNIEENIPKEQRGVGFFWNCNDFNPCLGGLTKNIRLHFKPQIYLTLPLYSNLRTKGVYIFGKEYDIQKKSVVVASDAEVRNESGETAYITIRTTVTDPTGRRILSFSSGETEVLPAGDLDTAISLSITPSDAYERTEEGYRARAEEEVKSVETDSIDCTNICSEEKAEGIRFWCCEDPYLYTVTTELLCQGKVLDCVETVTGFRKVSYDGNEGLKINDVRVWLTGYAQRSTNEWAAIGAATDWLKDVDAKLIRESNANHIRFMHVAGCPADIRAQRSTNEWAAIGAATDWLKDVDAKLIRESNANHIRFMHVAGCPADIRSFDRFGVICTQPAGDKERENFGRQWKQRVELMRDIIIYFRNSPSIVFWETGNNSISKEHMREMRLVKEVLDPTGGRFIGCRTINTEDVIGEAEYVGTMLNRHAARFQSERMPITETEYLREEAPRRVWDDFTPPDYDYDKYVGTMLNRHAARFQSERMPITETEYLREEAPRRVWDDFTPPDYDYDNLWLGKGGRKQNGGDNHDLTSEDLALYAARGYAEFFHDRIGGASGKDLYTAAAALCWTDSAQHGRQAFSENARMSGRVDPVRIKKQNFKVFQTIQSKIPMVSIVGHWNYPKEGEDHYRYALKEFDGTYWRKTGEYAYRNPKDKTIYVIGSYGVAKVELYINGNLAGVCEKPQDTFVFPFPHMDITRSGVIEAKAYDYEEHLVAEDKIETTGEPAELRLTVHTGEKGLLADGSDLAYVDVEVLDESGRICPLCDKRIDFTFEGPGVFLGGYNSGKFNGYGRQDSVIHTMHVYAECGNNRVFIRAGKEPGEMILKATMEGVAETVVRITSRECDGNELSKEAPQHLTMDPIWRM